MQNIIIWDFKLLKRGRHATLNWFSRVFWKIVFFEDNDKNMVVCEEMTKIGWMAKL